LDDDAGIDSCHIGFGTGILRVHFSHTVPVPAETVPMAGAGTYRPVKITVCSKTLCIFYPRLFSFKIFILIRINTLIYIHDLKKADTECTRSVLPGHPKYVVGGVNGVPGLTTTCKWG
jgi:hypothetical protein